MQVRTKVSEMDKDARLKLTVELSHKITNTTLSSEERDKSIKILNMLSKVEAAPDKEYDFDF